MNAEWKDRDIVFHVSEAPKGLIIMADEELLDQAIINLLRNAAEATKGKSPSKVWLSARINDVGRPVIEISDNGSGIDPELQEKIFQPFFTTKPEGSGVGLSLSRQVMIAHKGTISASTNEEGGSRFRLIF